MIGLSTGNFIRLGQDIKESIKCIKDSGCQAIELTFGYPKELHDLELDEQMIKDIRSFKYKSIHLPFHHIYDDDAETAAIIRKSLEMAKRIGADNFTIHHPIIVDKSILKEFFESDQTISFENLDKKYNIAIEEYKELLEEFPKARFVLDITHAMTIPDELSNLARWLTECKRLRQMHVSVFNEKSHQPLRHAKAELFDVLKMFDVPKILEVRYTDEQEYLNDIRLLKANGIY